MATRGLTDYEQGIIADMMLGSGVFIPRRNSRGHKAAKRLVRGGYIRPDESPEPIDRPQYVITPRGRGYFNQQKRMVGTVIARRVGTRERRKAGGQRVKRNAPGGNPAARQKQTLTEALKAAKKRGRV